jgi:hypothetical protein
MNPGIHTVHIGERRVRRRWRTWLVLDPENFDATRPELKGNSD